MINPTTFDIGRTVRYHPKHLEFPEYGVITSFNDKYIFVRYGTDKHSKATYRKDLSYAD